MLQAWRIGRCAIDAATTFVIREIVTLAVIAPRTLSSVIRSVLIIGMDDDIEVPN